MHSQEDITPGDSMEGCCAVKSTTHLAGIGYGCCLPPPPPLARAHCRLLPSSLSQDLRSRQKGCGNVPGRQRLPGGEVPHGPTPSEQLPGAWRSTNHGNEIKSRN